MDEPDYPMLDVGDFEVLDECEGEDDDEVISYDGNQEEHIDDEEADNHRGKQNNESFTHVDENSADNTDNILDVSIDIEENEFLESVAKDFSENIEEVEERPRITRLSSRREPTVQLRKLDMSTRKAKVEPAVADPPRKKPGPKSKTMNVPAPPAKKPIQRITFSDKSEKDDKAKNQKDSSKNEPQKKTDKAPQKNSSAPPPKNTSATPQKNSSAPPQKNSSAPAQKNSTAPAQKKAEQVKPSATPKKSVFLKADLTDDEIMMHFDEIENTVLTSDSFVIQEEVDQASKEEEKVDDESSQPSKVNDEENQVENKNEHEEEDWDRDADAAPARKKAQLVVEEEEELQESEMWYRQKLKDKQENIEIKFSKLAGLINYSYPCYKKWLDRNDTLYGTAICKVEPSRHIPLNQIQHSRWKFICNNKQNQQSAKEKENTDDTPKSDNNQSGWNVVPGVPDAKVEDIEEYPPFIMRAVKLFCEFLNNLEAENKENTKEESKDGTTTSEEKNEEPETSEEVQKAKEDEKKKVSIPPDGFVILMRSNRANHIMMNITGKNISQDFKDRVKEFYLEGPGKEANVKSFYCKSIIKENNVISTDSILLFGTETLDDTIGSIKINLPPKANMWANLAGVEIISKTVIEFLIPTQNTVVIEVGCGSGITSLLLASKCQKVIGIDIDKEVLEAKSLCSLNGITNVTFLTGKIENFLKEVEKLLGDSKAVAVINTNSIFGKTPKVIKGLRRLTTLGRIVLITNLTKQANRVVLELIQPGNEIYGNPFIPLRACLVDTTPKNFTFDIVMSMERRTMRNLLKIPPLDSTQVGLMSKSKQEALKKNSETGPPYQKGVPAKFARGGYTRGGFANPPFNKFGKRPYAEDDDEFEPGYKKSKPFEKPYGSNIRPNPLYDSKKSRTADEEDLRARLSSNRLEPAAIVSEISEQKKLLDAAKEKLTGASSSVDTETVKKLQEMLNLAIEKTNKLQSQLPPRSVWDRIAPADSSKDEGKGKPDDRKSPPMRGRLVKETGPKEILITTPNTRGFDSRPTVPVGKSKKYGNVPPAEPTLIEPLPASSKPYKAPHPSQKPGPAPYHKPGPNRYQESSYRKPLDNWDKGKPSGPPYSSKEPPPRYSKASPPRRPLSPSRPPMRSAPRQASPPRRPLSPPVRRQPMLSPPRRPASPPRRVVSPPRRAVSPPRRAASPPRRPMSPPRRPVSPGFRQHSSSSRNVPSNIRQGEPARRLSPPRRAFSPPKSRVSPPRQKSPPRRYADEWDIPTRGAVNESGWRQEKEKPTWDAQPAAASSNWDQTNSSNGNRYRPESSNWDNPSSGGQWKGGPPNNSGGSNWDVKKDPPRHEPRHGPPQIEPRHEPPRRPMSPPRHEPPRRPMSPPRHEPPRRPMSPPRHEPPRRPMSPPRHEPPRRPMSPPRHEPPRRPMSPPRHEPPRRMMSPPRHEPRHEPPRRPMSPSRHEPPRRPMSPPRHEARPEPRHEARWEPPPEKSDFDLPEDARDPWDDDPHPTPPKETPRWVPPVQQSQPTPSWQPKPNFPMNNMAGPNMAPPPNQNPNMGMGMNMGMNNQKPPVWQAPQQQQPQPNRNPSWIPQGNWQGGGNAAPPGGMPPNQGPHMVMNSWQPAPQQNFNNFQPARQFNSNPYMNNRR